MILQNFTPARKSGNIILTYWKLFSSDTHQSMKTSDNDLKVNRNIYPNKSTASGYIFRLTFRSFADVFILWWVSDEKSLQYVKIMLPLFRAVLRMSSSAYNYHYARKNENVENFLNFHSISKSGKYFFNLYSLQPTFPAPLLLTRPMPLEDSYR